MNVPDNSPESFRDLLATISTLSIGVIGDFCLDAYWQLDEGTPETSLETGRATEAVRLQRYGLGGAGNVAANLAALGVKNIRAYGARTDDVFGREIGRLLDELSVNTGGFIHPDEGWQTPVYAKPYRGVKEQNRIDFGGFNDLSPESADKLVGLLERDLAGLDALIVNQQVAKGIFTASVVRGLNRFAAKIPDKLVLLDSRHRIREFSGMTCKLNAMEAGMLFGESFATNEHVPLARIEEYCRTLSGKTGRPVILTRSSLGVYAFDGTRGYEFPALRADGPIDPVGAGDTVVAALASALGGRANLRTACAFAMAAAAVTVRKLRQTGTATPREIVNVLLR